MWDSILKNVINRFTDPVQLLFLAALVMLFLTIKLLIALLNRKEDAMDKLALEVREQGRSISEATKLLEVIVFGGRGGKGK